MLAQEHEKCLAMLKISQPQPKDASSDRFKIEVTTIMELFMAEACQMHDMPEPATTRTRAHNGTTTDIQNAHTHLTVRCTVLHIMHMHVSHIFHTSAHMHSSLINWPPVPVAREGVRTRSLPVSHKLTTADVRQLDINLHYLDCVLHTYELQTVLHIMCMRVLHISSCTH